MTNKVQNPTSTTEYEVKEEKKVNPTWEAFGKYPGAFTYVAPEMYD